jgi:hypothetical protein
MFAAKQGRRQNQTTPQILERYQPGRYAVWNSISSTSLQTGGPRLQAKLTVSEPGDPSELEADRLADQVIRMADPSAGSEPCLDSEAERDTLLRREYGASSGPGMSSDLASQISHLGLGQPLDPGTRALFEPRFGHNFSQVRVHTDEKAAHSARALQASAYTIGGHIVFAGGARGATNGAGNHLLAHELAHVVQQRTQSSTPMIQRQLNPPIPITTIRSPSSRPVEVNAVDARQEPSTPWYAPWRYTGPLANFFRGDITMTDITSMVKNIVALLSGRTMHRLNVMDHGNEHGVEIGDDWLASPADVAPHAGTLGRLRPHFASGAFVHMQNCRAGQNRGIICALSAAFGVPVYAGTGLHNPLIGFNFGDYVRCEPSGAYNPDAGRPRTPTPPPWKDDLIA